MVETNKVHEETISEKTKGNKKNIMDLDLETG